MTVSNSKRLLQSCIDSHIKAVHMGYIAHLEWIEKKSKRYYQVKCDRCDKFHIWKRKALTNKEKE